MKISAINQAQRPSFSSVNSDFLEKFHEKTKNSADMTDTILVPRTIFKGYLGIMSGTTLVTLGALLGKFKLLSKTLSITGLLASLYGTYAFVRPYIIKDAKGVATSKDK
jgi:hypothetical protein